MNSTQFATKQNVTFTCGKDQTVGAYMLIEGESLRAVSNGMGMFYLYSTWSDGPLGLYKPETINDIAGGEVVQ